PALVGAVAATGRADGPSSGAVFVERAGERVAIQREVADDLQAAFGESGERDGVRELPALGAKKSIDCFMLYIHTKVTDIHRVQDNDDFQRRLTSRENLKAREG